MKARALEQTGELPSVPPELWWIMERLREAGFAVWVVGGAIRDYLLGILPHDWDLATDATPQQIMDLFPRIIPLGVRHGTVMVHTDQLDVEVTSYRRDAVGLEGIIADLERRDFTINALAVSYPDGRLLDPFGGRRDLGAGRIRAVEDATARFREDPLRTLRAARLVSVYGFRLAPGTFAALKEQAVGLARVAWERIREEMLKLLMGDGVIEAFELLRLGRVLAHVLPELLEGYRKKQNEFHQFDVYHHIVQTVHHSPRRLRVRLAALFHDIAKPRVRKRIRGTFRFYGHAKASAQLAVEIMNRWKMSAREIEEVTILVHNHMLMDTDKWSNAAVRRLIARVGANLLDDLLDLARADRKSHVEKSSPELTLRTLRDRIDHQLRLQPPLQVKDLAVTGHDVMRVLHLEPGPKVGEALRWLKHQVIKEPAWNRRETLLELLETECRK